MPNPLYDHLKKVISESEEKYILFEEEKETLLELKKSNESEIIALNEALEKERGKLDNALNESRADLEKLNNNRNINLEKLRKNAPNMGQHGLPCHHAIAQNPKFCFASISTPGASQKLSLTASESSRNSPPA